VFKQVIVGCIALAVVGVFGFGALVWRPAIDLIVPPAPGSYRHRQGRWMEPWRLPRSGFDLLWRALARARNSTRCVCTSLPCPSSHLTRIALTVRPHLALNSALNLPMVRTW